jgi:hypothetical protein
MYIPPDTLHTLFFMGLGAGALGGVVAAINGLFSGFRALPPKPMAITKAAQRTRAVFYVFRIFLGAILGAMITFWFVSDVVNNSLPIEKLFFIQFAVGLAGSILAPKDWGDEGASTLSR